MATNDTKFKKGHEIKEMSLNDLKNKMEAK
jgi:hypothetical protein